MPSGVTHILLMKELQNRIEHSMLKTILAANRDFLQVGAVAPDLPYASVADDDLFLDTQTDLADKFHYEKTDAVPLLAFENIRAQKSEMDAKTVYATFAFFLGYVSHIVADGLGHPFVRDKVGNYAEHQSEHRVLEMQIDVLFFDYLTSRSGVHGEFNNSELQQELLNFTPLAYPQIPAVMKMFSDTVRQAYGLDYPPDLVEGWVSGLYRLFELASGKALRIFHSFDPVKDLVFPNLGDIAGRKDDILTLKRPVDRPVNFLGQPSVHFFDDIVPRFYDRFIPIAEKAFSYVFADGPELTSADIPLINLDTGRLLAAGDNLDAPPILWT